MERALNEERRETSARLPRSGGTKLSHCVLIRFAAAALRRASLWFSLPRATASMHLATLRNHSPGTGRDIKSMIVPRGLIRKQRVQLIHTNDIRGVKTHERIPLGFLEF